MTTANTVLMQIDETEAKLLLRILRNNVVPGDEMDNIVTGDEIDTVLLIEERLDEALVLLATERERACAHVWETTGLIDRCKLCGAERA